MLRARRTWCLLGLAVAGVTALAGFCLAAFLERELREQARSVLESDRVDRGIDLAWQRSALNRELSAGLAEGSLSLREAVARLRDHLRMEPPVPGMLSGLDLVSSLPGNTEQERMARYLVRRVEAQATQRPDGAEVMRELDRQLHEMLSTGE